MKRICVRARLRPWPTGARQRWAGAKPSGPTSRDCECPRRRGTARPDAVDTRARGGERSHSRCTTRDRCACICGHAVERIRVCVGMRACAACIPACARACECARGGGGSGGAAQGGDLHLGIAMDMYVYVCLCVCARVRMYACACRMHVGVCACVGVRACAYARAAGAGIHYVCHYA